MTRPLIVTLGLAPDDERWLTALRRAHFPPERNYIPAHLTLFHALPGDAIDDVTGTLTQIAETRAPIPYRIARVLNFGTGCAFGIDTPEACALHAQLQAVWRTLISAQDARPLDPHVTIQNKVDRTTAQALVRRMRDGFTPRDGVAPRLDLWHYDGGPWTPANSFHFKDSP